MIHFNQAIMDRSTQMSNTHLISSALSLISALRFPVRARGKIQFKQFTCLQSVLGFPVLRHESKAAALCVIPDQSQIS